MGGHCGPLPGPLSHLEGPLGLSIPVCKLGPVGLSLPRISWGFRAVAKRLAQVPASPERTWGRRGSDRPGRCPCSRLFFVEPGRAPSGGGNPLGVSGRLRILAWEGVGISGQASSAERDRSQLWAPATHSALPLERSPDPILQVHMATLSGSAMLWGTFVSWSPALSCP